jgi:hypothetical protein
VAKRNLFSKGWTKIRFLCEVNEECGKTQPFSKGSREADWTKIRFLCEVNEECGKTQPFFKRFKRSRLDQNTLFMRSK